MDRLATFVGPLTALLLAPLLLGVINRTKAFFGGRHGQPLLQPYHDLIKLLRKSAVYSRTTTWVFPTGTLVGLVVTVTAMAVLPFADRAGPVSFSGDFLLLAYLLALGRFLLVTSALDTGSSFEGMGASREVAYSSLAEIALLLGFAALAWQARGWSIIVLVGDEAAPGPVPVLVATALFVVLLWENARIPFDDPNTHLELTMVHEVMVLDHSGPDLALIHYTAALKLWLFAALVMGILLPCSAWPWWLGWPAAVAGQFAIAVLVGVVESIMARLRLRSLPQLLTGAIGLSALAMILVMAR